MGEPVLDEVKGYTTDVMPLVAFLMHEGFTPQCTDYDEDERRCYWVFLITTSLLAAIERYHNGDGKVEPKNFSAMFHRISRERSRLVRQH
jgi:hypothetical protein